MSRLRRVLSHVCLVALSLSGSAAAGDAAAAVGDLTQKPGAAGCLSASALCSPATALETASAVTVSPDGRNAYVASLDSRPVAVFDRAADGSLAQKPGTAGCISQTGSGGACATGRALEGANSVTVSPDGSSAYVASADSDAVALFDRAADGSLT